MIEVSLRDGSLGSGSRQGSCPARGHPIDGFRDGTGMECVMLKSARLLCFQSRHTEPEGFKSGQLAQYLQREEQHQDLSVWTRAHQGVPSHCLASE